MKHFVLVAVLSVAPVAGAQDTRPDPFTGGDAQAGAGKAAVCGACHGPGGNSSNPEWPKLAGQHAAYTYHELAELKSGTRKSPVMGPQASGLSDQDMRDLAAFFWPYHLWLRETLMSGQLPWWDPYVANGQAAVADPLRQVLFLPALLPRLMLPPALGFNITIALPFPIAALGCYLFARRRMSAQAAALAAAVFAVSGPVLSTGNFPNVSWSVASFPGTGG